MCQKLCLIEHTHKHTHTLMKSQKQFPIPFLKETNEARHHNDSLQTCEAVTRECLRRTHTPRDSAFSSRSGSAGAATPPDSEMDVYNRSVSVGVCGREKKKRESHEQQKEKKNTQCVCMHVWGGAGIAPEPQLTQTQKNIAAWQTHTHTQLGVKFGTTSLVSVRAFFQNIGHWLAAQEGIWNSIISTQNNTSQIPVRALCTRPAHRAICLSAGWLFV